MAASDSTRNKFSFVVRTFSGDGSRVNTSVCSSVQCFSSDTTIAGCKVLCAIYTTRNLAIDELSVLVWSFAFWDLGFSQTVVCLLIKDSSCDASCALGVIRCAAVAAGKNAGFDFSLGADSSARLDVSRSNASRDGSVDVLS